MPTNTGNHNPYLPGRPDSSGGFQAHDDNGAYWRKAMYSKNNENDLFELIDEFIHGKISAPGFEIGYMKEWRKYRALSGKTELNKNNQEYFDRIFTALDVYCSNPDLRDEMTLMIMNYLTK